MSPVASATLAPAEPDASPATTVTDMVRSWKAPIALAVIGFASLLLFGILPAGGRKSTFTIATDTDAFRIDPVTVPSQTASIILGVVACLVAAVALWLARSGRKLPVWATVIFGIAVVLSLLTWSVAGKDTTLPLTGLLQGSLFLAIPLVFGALSGMLCERSGIVNIAIEGQLLGGAFLAAVVASLTHSAYVGLIAAPLAGVLVSAILVFFAIRYTVDQIIVGVVLNVLVVGVTSYLFSTVLKDNASTLNSPPRLNVIEIPWLSQIPVIGPVLFRQTALVYIMYVVVALLQVMVFRSRWGLRMRAVGEDPKAADTVGIKVIRTRIRSTLLGGAVAGLGGAFFTVANGLAFGKEMTAGKGYIALAAMILGRWSPKGALAAALLFGFADSLQSRLGIIGTPIPSQIMLMAPYLVTILAVAGLVGRVRAPAAEGVPYVK